ncbi:NXPE family member 3-like isoform X1 [Branchiostoma floridae]|uniref:NXPE family member 3-like isoform X1 n=1 Tax=Branchiostoma floridae TaxID=7739 RepID=A0A9J7LU58_BRAFL|nr:NXPE family member 3-like isoform X1 [Branchiostoma floridae]
MGAKTIVVRGLGIILLLLAVLLIKSKPTIFDGNMNRMLPNQIGSSTGGRQVANKDDNVISSGGGEPANPKEMDKMLGNELPPSKDGRHQNSPNKEKSQGQRVIDNAASSGNKQPIMSKEKDTVLPNQNSANKDGGQGKNIDDNSVSSANDKPIISQGKDKALPNQNAANKDERQGKNTNNNTASSANVQPIISKENDKALPNQNTPNRNAGQENALKSKEQKVLANQNPPQKDGRESKDSGNNNAATSDLPTGTSSEKTGAHIFNRKQIYKVGDELLVRIIARDAYSRPKTIGGDFFTTMLSSRSPVNASTAGRIVDYGNGTYIARFVLGWPGLVTAAVRLIHSSEAVNILKKSRSHKIRRFFSCGFFDEKMNNTEWTSCTFNPIEKASYSENVCDFSRPDINVTWYCHRPKSAPCDPPVECRQDRNKSLRVDDLFTEEEKASLLKGYTDRVEVSANISVIVQKNDKGIEPKSLPQCGARLPEPASEGYWYNGTWYSLRCRVQRGFDRQAAIRCLRNKNIYLQGDSTLRQWYSDLAKTINTVDNPNESPKFLGPTVTTNHSNNINIHFRFHHFPVSGPPTRPMNVFSFAADDIMNIVGGPNVVFVLGLWAHFCAEPVETFRSRLYGIRHAIVYHHSKYPGTKFFVRSSNTRGFVTFSHLRDNSNWYAYQLLLEARDILGDLNVTIIDVWDMSLCQWHEHNVHPHHDVVLNHLDMFYSYICPL